MPTPRVDYLFIIANPNPRLAVAHLFIYLFFANSELRPGRRQSIYLWLFAKKKPPVLYVLATFLTTSPHCLKD